MERGNPKFVSVSQAAFGIGLRSALGCSAVKRKKVEAGRQAFLVAVEWLHHHPEVVSGAPLK